MTAKGHLPPSRAPAARATAGAGEERASHAEAAAEPARAATDRGQAAADRAHNAAVLAAAAATDEELARGLQRDELGRGDRGGAAAGARWVVREIAFSVVKVL